MKADEEKARPDPVRPRRLPDKWLAVALFLLLLGLYLATGNKTVEQMMLTAFGLLCVAISDGLRRVSEWSKNRLEQRGSYKQSDSSKKP